MTHEPTTPVFSAKGYLLRLSAERYELLKRKHEFGFEEPVSAFDHSKGATLICFIFNADRLTFVGEAARGNRAGTGLSRLNIKNILRVPEAPDIGRIIASAPSFDRTRIARYLTQTGLTPEGTFRSLVDTVVEIAPSTRSLLSRFGSRRAALIARLSPATRNALAEQKETLNTALYIAAMDRSPVSQWTPREQAAPTSFLEGLPNARLREDPMIQNDLQALPGYSFVKSLPCNAALFENSQTRLTVIVTNRQPLEESLGADLIYYNETYASFVFVQYKAMEPGGVSPVFRLPNLQLEKEIQRMKSTLQALASSVDRGSAEDFRLNANPFFLKFCSRLIFDPDSTKLTPGIYLPLDLWDRLAADPKLIGPRGGIGLSFANAGRYLDNTHFAHFVSNAWVGTNHAQSSMLEDLIRQSIETGRTITLAMAVCKYPKYSGESPEIAYPDESHE